MSSAALLYSTLRQGVLKHVNEVFPDRAAQLKELRKIISEAEAREQQLNRDKTEKNEAGKQEGKQGGVEEKASTPEPSSHSLAESRLLVSLLEILQSLQRRVLPPASAQEVVSVQARVKECFEGFGGDGHILSALAQDQLHSIGTQISAYCATFLVFTLHTYIWNHSPLMEETIEYWSARTNDKFRFWYLFEKTPLFWARYFRLVQVPHQLVHPELEVAIRLAWLQRLRLALQYFLGKSQYSFAQYTLNEPLDVETMTATLLLDIENLHAATGQAFAMPGLLFETAPTGLLRALPLDASADPASPLDKPLPRLQSTRSMARSLTKLTLQSTATTTEAHSPHPSLHTSSASLDSLPSASAEPEHRPEQSANNQEPVRQMVVENLDANLMLSAPPVDEVIASYRARERITQANLHISLKQRQQFRHVAPAKSKISPRAAPADLAETAPAPLLASYAVAPKKLQKSQHVEAQLPASAPAESSKPSSSQETPSAAPTLASPSSTQDIPLVYEAAMDPWERYVSGEKLNVARGQVMECIRLCELKLTQNGIPPFYKRNWMLCAAIGACAAVGVFRVWRNWGRIEEQLLEAKHAFLRFLYEHAVLPIVSIYKTIRYDETEAVVLSKASLDEDVESLVRMVSDFHRDKKMMDSDPMALETLARETRMGAIPSVMEAYEREIGHPIANALGGDLLRLALIQVQKQKVDIEKAMAQLDRLLKQNEINFQLIALFPVILLGSALASLWLNSSRDPYKTQHQTIRALLRRVAIHINRSSLDDKAVAVQGKPSSSSLTDSALYDDSTSFEDPHVINPATHFFPRLGRAALLQDPALQMIDLEASNLDYTNMHNEDFGLLLCLVAQLLDHALTLPVQERLGFVEDVVELANVKFSARQRLATIQRMYNNYKFLTDHS